jgi:ribosomal protein S4
MAPPPSQRWRCLTVGCNPVLYGQDQADDHVTAHTGHRVAKWPVRSQEGHRRARKRNQTGYYDKYNVGPKDLRYRLQNDTEADDGFDNLEHQNQ